MRNRKLRYFSNRDNFGGIDNMDYEFLKKLDTARHVIRQPCSIHCGFDVSPIHVGKSRHFENPCDAADFHYIETLRSYKVESNELQTLHKNLDRLALCQKPRTIFEMALLLRLSGLKRIGIYPFGIPRTYFHADDSTRNHIDFWIGLSVEGIFKKLKKYLPEFKKELDSLLKKIRNKKMNKVIVYISPK